MQQLRLDGAAVLGCNLDSKMVNQKQKPNLHFNFTITIIGVRAGGGGGLGGLQPLRFFKWPFWGKKASNIYKTT